MYIRNLDPQTNPNIETTTVGPFTICERKICKSPVFGSSAEMYFFNKLGGRTRQVLCDATNGVVLSKGAMQSMGGRNVKATTGIKGGMDLMKKAFRATASGENVINPEYIGEGFVITEPTTKFLIPLDMQDFNGSAVIEDTYFYACESSLRRKTVSRKTFSSAVAGGEGMFNLCLEGRGAVLLESDVAPEDLIYVYLENETLKIDGPMAIAWSGSLNFTVGRSSETLIGSAMNGDGLVNIYQGTGLVIYKALSKT